MQCTCQGATQQLPPCGSVLGRAELRSPVGKTAKPGFSTSFMVFSVTVARVMLLYTTEWVTLPAAGGGEGVGEWVVGEMGENKGALGAGRAAAGGVTRAVCHPAAHHRAVLRWGRAAQSVPKRPTALPAPLLRAGRPLSGAPHSPVMEKRNSGWGWMWGCSTVQGARVTCRGGMEGDGKGKMRGVLGGVLGGDSATVVDTEGQPGSTTPPASGTTPSHQALNSRAAPTCRPA